MSFTRVAHWVVFFCVATLASTAVASASDTVHARMVWTSRQLSELRVTRDSKPIRLSTLPIDVVFKDPSGKRDIEKILLDPSYRPGTPQVADFWVVTSITLPSSRNQISETALCSWNAGKSIATCSIEDDGGRFRIARVKQGNDFASARFQFVLQRLDGYSGFRIAEDRSAGGDPIAIDVKLRHRPRANFGLRFR